MIPFTFFTLVLFWFLLWAYKIPIGGLLGGPDEVMRLLVPQYIYNHNSLPTGYENEVIYGPYYWSYAFYPQFLGPIISALFMDIMGIFRDSSFAITFAARMASVAFAFGTVVVVGLTSSRLFEKYRHRRLYTYLSMALLAFWPQFAFLAGYVNNDIVGIFGVSIIVYACLLGLKDKWNIKNSLILSLGFVVCLLGYTNSYGFVLFGGLFYLVSIILQKHNVKKIISLSGIIFAIVVVLAGPLFIRNAVIYNGDFLGMSTFKARATQGEKEHGGKSQNKYSEVVGKSSVYIFTDKQYISIQFESFIARFGAMKVAPGKEQLVVYELFLISGLAGIVWIVFDRRREILIKKNRTLLFYGLFILFSTLTTIALSVYYTTAIDYQPQGRYIIYLLIPGILFGLYGLVGLLDRVVIKQYRNVLLLLFVFIYVSTAVLLFKNYLFP